MVGIRDISKDSGIASDHIYEAFQAILKRVAGGETVTIRNFGSFKRRHRRGGVIKTSMIPGGEATYPEGHNIRFTISGNARTRVSVVAAKELGIKPPKLKKKATGEAPAPKVVAPPKSKSKKAAPSSEDEAQSAPPAKAKGKPKPVAETAAEPKKTKAAKANEAPAEKPAKAKPEKPAKPAKKAAPPPEPDEDDEDELDDDDLDDDDLDDEDEDEDDSDEDDEDE